MEEGIYIIPSNKEFMRVIEKMSESANCSSSRIQYLHKPITSLKEIEKEVNILDKCEIMTFNGFYTKRMIKVSLSLNKEIFNVSYTFNSSLFLYGKFRRYLMKRC